MKNNFVSVAAAVLLAGGTALAQSSVFEGASDSYSAGFAACKRTSGNPDKHGTPEAVRKSEAMRGWKSENSPPEKAQVPPAAARPNAMAANEGSRPADHGSASNGGPGSAK